LLQYEQDILEL